MHLVFTVEGLLGLIFLAVGLKFLSLYKYMRILQDARFKPAKTFDTAAVMALKPETASVQKKLELLSRVRGPRAHKQHLAGEFVQSAVEDDRPSRP